MRYGKGHKEETRRRVLDAASSRLRADGVERTGVAALMAEVGLTHGGFYAHFSSKDDLVREAISAALTQSREAWTAAATAARERGENAVEAIVRGYLGTAHRDHPERGCAIAALAGEVARGDRRTRIAMAERADALIEVITDELSISAPRDQAHRTATAIVALMAGTLQMARVATDLRRSEEILQSGVEGALWIALKQ